MYFTFQQIFIFLFLFIIITIIIHERMGEILVTFPLMILLSPGIGILSWIIDEIIDGLFFVAKCIIAFMR